jgi:hypothetical protein
LRLAIYGEVSVARTFARFLAVGGRLQTEEQKQAFIAMVRAMRADEHRKDSNLTDDELLRVAGATPDA